MRTGEHIGNVIAIFTVRNSKKNNFFNSLILSQANTVTVSLAKAATVKISFADGDKTVNVATTKLGTQTLSKVAVHVDGVTAREAKIVADAKIASDAALAKAAADAKVAQDAAVAKANADAKTAQDTAVAKANADAKTALDAALAKANADAKVAQDAAVKVALTDTLGKFHTTVDAAITSNDDAVISTATGAKITTVAALTAAYTPTFSVSADAAVSEGADATFTVKLNIAASVATSVNIGLTPTGGATAGTDYNAVGTANGTGVTASGTTLTFAAGVTAATLKFPVLTDSVSPENGEGLTLALASVTGSAAKVSTTAASSTINITDVPPQTTPSPVAISPTNISATATAGADTFNIAAGNYAATIAGFGTGDTLVFDPNSTQSVTNKSGTDGIITIAGSLNNQQVVVTLTGVNPTLDNQVFSLASFTNAFAPEVVVGPSTITNISASATSGTGTSGVDTFNIASGNFNASIASFGVNDKLIFAPGSVPAITNTSGADGNITVSGVLNNQLVTIQLTGVSTALDAQVFNVASFNTAFGTGSLV